MSSPEYDMMEEPVSTDIELIARRELAVRATDAIAEVLEVDVSVNALLRLAGADEPTPVRLAAKRALRCIEAIGRDDSLVVRKIGEAGIYHYVEGVIEFGADEAKFLELMDQDDLSAEETTGMYALREAIQDVVHGEDVTFPAIHAALRRIGMTPGQAVVDSDATVAALHEAGCFVDHAGWRTFDHPIFDPNANLQQVPLARSKDTPSTHHETVKANDWLRKQLETKRFQLDEEQ